MSRSDAELLWQRAMQLIVHRRYAEAEQELRRLLAIDPDLGPAHAMLAQALAAQQRFDAALEEARLAVTLDGDDAFAHRTMAAVHLARDEFPAAAAAAARAIALDPAEPDGHGIAARAFAGQKLWRQALAAADAGLALDPADVDCLNLRSHALVQLGRGREAQGSLDASIAADPDNPYTHQARGFAMLSAGDSKAALVHFREALRRDPTLESARQGLVEALKARNPIYRVMLAWMLWLSRFSEQRQRQILVGAWLGAMVLRRALDTAGYTTAAQVAGFGWLGVVLFTACAVPFFNLLLLLHPIGRHALSRPVRNDALLLGGAIVLLIAALVANWFERWAFADGAVWIFLLYLLPVAGLGLFGTGWARRVLQGFCIAMLVAFLGWAVRLEMLIADLRIDGGTTGSLTARVRETDLGKLREHASLQGTMIWALVLSTWFVMLAPKGRPRRER